MPDFKIPPPPPPKPKPATSSATTYKAKPATSPQRNQQKSNYQLNKGAALSTIFPNRQGMNGLIAFRLFESSGIHLSLASIKETSSSGMILITLPSGETIPIVVERGQIQEMNLNWGPIFVAVTKLAGDSEERAKHLFSEAFSTPEHQPLEQVFSRVSSHSDRVLVEFLRFIPQAAAKGEADFLIQIFEKGAHVSDIEILNQSFGTYLTFPNSIREQVRQIFLSGEVSGSHFEEIVRQFQEIISFEAPTRENYPAFGFPRERLIASGVSSFIGTKNDKGLSASCVKEDQAVNNPEITLRRQIGVVLVEMLSLLPQHEVSEMKEILVKSLFAPVSEARLNQFAEKILHLEATVQPQVVEKMLKAWINPREGVQLLVLKLLKKLEQAKKENPKVIHLKDIPDEVKYLSRNRRSPKVQAEALEIAMDMGNGQNKDKHEMAALLAELELIPTLQRLLKSRDPSLILQGLMILLKAWAWLASGPQERFADFLLNMIKTHSSKKVAQMASDIVWKKARVIGSKKMVDLMSSINAYKILRRSAGQADSTYIGVIEKNVLKKQLDPHSGR